MDKNPTHKKRIALDMDEVIADVVPKFLDRYEQDFGQRPDKSVSMRAASAASRGLPKTRPRRTTSVSAPNTQPRGTRRATARALRVAERRT